MKINVFHHNFENLTLKSTVNEDCILIIKSTKRQPLTNNDINIKKKIKIKNCFHGFMAIWHLNIGGVSLSLYEAY